MNATMLNGLLCNAALLLALGLVYDTLALRTPRLWHPLQQAITGLVLGAIGIALMMNSVALAPGVIFDTRSVLLSLSGLFFGSLPTLVAVAMTAAWRLYFGGVGALGGVCVIVTSAAIGLTWRHLRLKKLGSMGLGELYLMGITVHLAMSFWMLTRLGGVTRLFLTEMAAPVMIIFPVGEALLGRLLSGRGVRQQAVAELRNSEARYRLLFEEMITGFSLHEVITDAAGTPVDYRFLAVNAAFERLTGLKGEEIIGRSVREVLPGIEEVWIERYGKVALTGESIRFEQYSGSLGRYYEVRAYCPEPGKFAVISLDVTEKRRAEEALRESEERFRSLVECAPVPIFIQADFRFAYVNAAAIKAYGAAAADELLGTPLFERIHPDYWEIVTERIHAMNEEHGSMPIIEETFLKLDGTPFSVEVSAVPFFYQGRHGGLIFFRDITERKRAELQRLQIEQQIQQTQKLESLGVLAGGIAHDFNNILMAVLGHADLALLELPPMSPARDSIREIEKASRRAAELCRQMLAYSGRGRFMIEQISLRDLIEEMVHLLKTTISKKALLNLHLAKNLPPMRGDATQIRQIIMNLVINASEAIGERSGVITISTGAMECPHNYLASTYLNEDLPAGLYLWLQVSDTGCGMDKETQSRIFEPFFTTKFTGRGLGMAAVMGIVRGHKGALNVYSEPGKGTTFKILFPAVTDDGTSNHWKHESAVGEWKGSGTILLVDDEETIRTLGKRMLERLGFTVVTAEDGRHAVEVYGAQPEQIRLVLLDMTMPHMNGEEAFRELRQLNPAVCVLISSGYTESEIASRFAGKGVAGFVQKPYTLEALKARLQTALGESA